MSLPECREVRQLSEAFVSDQLPVGTTQAVAAHLEHCPKCRAEIEGLRRLRAATRAAFEGAVELAPHPELAVDLRSRLQAREMSQPVVMPRRRWLAVAASALIAAGAAWGWRALSSGRMTTLAQAAAGDHRHCALAFNLAEQPIPLAEAARRYGGAYAALNTVQPSTGTLSGGPLQVVDRHSCVYEGRRFAHLVLRYRGEIVSLLVTDDPSPGGALLPDVSSPAERPALLPASDGFRLASFSDPSHVVFVVSSLGERDLQEVAQVMAGPVRTALHAG